MTLSRRQRISIAAAPLFAAVALLLGHAHAFGAGDRADTMQGIVVGIGIGIALTALVRRGRGAGPRG
jgi:hypothetical protein